MKFMVKGAVGLGIDRAVIVKSQDLNVVRWGRWVWIWGVIWVEKKLMMMRRRRRRRRGACSVHINSSELELREQADEKIIRKLAYNHMMPWRMVTEFLALSRKQLRQRQFAAHLLVLKYFVDRILLGRAN